MKMEIIQEKRRYEMSTHIVNYPKMKSMFHWHENMEICQVINKPCRFFIDGKIIEAQEGDFVIIRELAIHSFWIDSDDTDVRIIQFPINILYDINPTVKPIKTHISAKELEAYPEIKEKLEYVIAIIESEGHSRYSKDNPFFCALLSALYFLLMRKFEVEEEKGILKKDKRVFYKIAEYVNEHYKEDINVTSIAEKLNLSRGHLSSLFAKYSAIGLNEYINTLRIKNANQLLNEGYSITDAALESGFQSIRTFNYAYKSCMGINPTEYVKTKK